MLLYLSAQENEALFSNWLEQQGVFTDFAPIEKYPSIKTALTANRAMPNYKYVLFYFSSFPLPEEDLISAVTFIRTFHHARIIVFSPQGNETYELFGKLVDIGLRELVSVSDDTDLQAELQECLSPDGKGFANATELAVSAHIEKAQAYIRPKLLIPDGFRLTVGVAGAQSRIGVTTQAFFIHHALKALGCTPCIIDVRGTFLELLMSVYREELEVGGSLLTIRGTTFAHDVQIGTGHNAFIYDCGILSPDSLPAFEGCALRFLCAGAKAWELSPLVETLGKYQEKVQQLILSFVPKKEEKKVIELLDGKLPSSFAPWNPDIWDKTDTEWHERILFPLIKEAILS